MSATKGRDIERHYGPVSPVVAILARGILRVLGWRVAGELPPDRRLVAIYAPHTSSWDFPLLFLLACSVGVRGNFLAKESLCKPPRSWFMRPAGAIPVDRGHHEHLVDAIVATLAKHDAFYLAIAPEGTRSFTDHWKTGFYYIALKAGTRIVCLYTDFPSKTLGFGPVIQPTGDIEQDFKPIQAFYAETTPKRPENRSEMVLR